MRKVLLTMLLVLAMAFAAFANSPSDHVKLGVNGKGDALIYPLYFTANGLDTDFTVINTSDNESVVAKVVLKSHRNSEEVRDFLIFLTPNDVFTAKVYTEAGEPRIMSTDDSVITFNSALIPNVTADDLTMYDENNPFDHSLVAPSCVDDSADWGYIEIIESAAISTSDVPKDAVTGAVDKTDLALYYLNNNIETYYTVNSLTGFAGVSLPGNYAEYAATALADLNFDTKLGVGNVTDLNDGANNTLVEVEAALTKNQIAVPYVNSASKATLGIVNFPTKLSAKSNPDVCESSSTVSPYFTAIDGDSTDIDSVAYAFTYYNLEELSETEQGCIVSPCDTEDSENSFGEEVNLVTVAPQANYEEGWGRLNFTGGISATASTVSGDNITVTDAPAIVLGLNFTSDGMSFLKPAFEFSAVNNADDSTVYNANYPAEPNQVYQLLDVGNGL